MASSPRNNHNRGGRQTRGRRNGRNHTRGRQSNNRGPSKRGPANRDRAPQLPTPIRLSTDFKEADLLTAKIQRGANKKVVFIAKAGSTESYFFALRDFETKADALGMTLRDKVVNLQSILAFGYQATYQQAIIGLPAAGPIDQAQYDAVKATIASAICTNTDRSSLIEYIRTGCRHVPASMSAREFFIRLDILVQYAFMMPGPDALPTEDDIKKTFFGCQRPDDQSAFIQDAKKLPAAATRAELINFMEIRSTLRSSFPSTNRDNSSNGRDNRDYSRNKNGGGGDRYDDHDSDNDHEYDDEPSSDESCSSDNDDESSNESDDSRHDNRDSRNKRNGNRNHNGGDRNGDNQARKRSRDKDKCPFHPEASHTWSDCFGNPNGRNWKPQFAARLADILAKAKSGSNNNNNNNNRGGDKNAHVHDD
jgi:hypothetical protein